jgi:hypothetical protein
MIGTILNVIAVWIGGGIGMLFGAKIPDRLKDTVISGMGLFTTAIGFKLFLKTENELIVLGGIVIGSLIGEALHIEDGLHHLGAWLEKRFAGGGDEEANKFIRGFLTASLLFCIGPMTIIGSINDGLRGDYNLLAIKSVLDGFASIAFASTLGVGVLFSSIIVLLYQGGITLLAAQLNAILSDAMMMEMTAAGGVLLMGIGVSSLLELKKIRVGNMLPALVIAPLIVWLAGLIQ